jgi:Lrp/AsnC family transcriptional regulator for asnA, asnC and gidA
MTNLDELDIKILSLLARDGRMPSAEIARIVGDNKSKTGYRVNSLIENGVVSILGVIDPQVFGYTANADVYIKVEADKIREVANRIAQYKEIRFVMIVFGEYNVNFQIWTKTLSELFDFVTEQIGVMPGVIAVSVNIVAEVIKEIYGWSPIEDTDRTQ